MRVFLACPIPPREAQVLAGWTASRLDPEVARFVAPENLHVTVAFFGEVSLEVAEELCQLTRSVAWKAPDVHAAGMQLYGRNAIAIRVHALFSEPMEAPLRKLWYRQPDSQRHRDPKPHVTLARLRPGAKLPALPDAPEPVHFSLDRLVLYQSLLSSEGSSYVELATAR